MNASICWNKDFAPPKSVQTNWISRVVLITLTSICIVTITLFSLYTYNSRSIVSSLIAKGHQQLIEARKEMRLDLKRVISELLYMRASSAVMQYQFTGNKSFVSHDWLAFMQSSGIYDQIRFIDLDGVEKIRVNYNEGTPEIVPEYLLQDISDRNYFKEARCKNLGEIYISPLDLNTENGAISQPHKPMFRFLTPVGDKHGDIVGYLAFNYLAETSLSRLQTLNVEILNQDGFWLHSKDPRLEWGFMLEHEYSYLEQKREVWDQITQGQMQVGSLREGVVLSSAFHLIPDSGRTWYIIHEITPEMIQWNLRSWKLFFLTGWLALSGLLVWLTYLYITHKLEKEKIQKYELEKVKMAGALASIRTICHEFNQPLTVIMGYTKILTQITDEKSKKRVYVMNIKTSCERLSEVMKNLQNVTWYEEEFYTRNTTIMKTEPGMNTKATQDRKQPPERAEPAPMMNG